MNKHVQISRPLGSIMVTGELYAPQCQRIIEGIHAVCLERQWLLHRATTRTLDEAVRDYSPDAVIVLLTGDEYLKGRRLRRKPIISAGHDLTKCGWPSVVPDDREIGRHAARHLLDRGFRALAVFGGWGRPDDRSWHGFRWAIDRIEGFMEVARSAGVEVDRYGDRIDPATGKPEGARFGRLQLRQWVASLPRHTGVLAPCDSWGQSLAVCCRELGRPVPEDIAVVGVDDIPAICNTSDPPLSSVAVPWEQIGRLAAELAGNILAGRQEANRLVTVPPTGVTVRRSSDTLAVSDPDIAEALRIILAHADRPLRVSQILRQVPMAERRLERYFKRIVGRRMVDEIRRVHIERAKGLLAETDLPVPIIARKCGFGCAPRLNVAFQRETGTTPSKFRRRYRLAG